MNSRLLPLALVSFTLAWNSTAFAGTTAYRNLILGDSPIVYYELDETSGTNAANSGSLGAALDATISGTITLNQATFAQGGTAYDFGGGHVQALAALPNSLNEWTVEAWVNYDKNSASNIVSNDQGGWNDDVLIGLRPENGAAGIPAGNFGVSQQGAPGTTRDTPSAPLAANEWHHVAVVGSTLAGTLTVYIDGAQVAQDSALVNGVTFNGADGIGSAHLALGAAREGGTLGRTFGGLLDEVAVYDSVLDVGTIASHYAIGASETVESFELIITPNAATPGNYDFGWESQDGKLYDLVSSTDLLTAPGTWPVWDSRSDLAGTAPLNSLSDIPGGGLKRFFAVVEKDPPPLLSEDFDAAAALPAGWTSNGPINGTDWEVGVPFGVTSGPTMASSVPNCAGTNIGGYYTENADVSLISPSFLVPVGSGASLNFRQFIDTDFVGALGDLGSVRILDADNFDTPIAGLEITGIEGDGTGGWTNGATLPMTAGDVGGKNIKVEFRFVSNAGTVQDTDVWSGFYVDDVVVTEVAP